MRVWELQAKLAGYSPELEVLVELEEELEWLAELALTGVEGDAPARVVLVSGRFAGASDGDRG